MLDVDAAKALIRAARTRTEDREIIEILEAMAETLDRAHRELARIPEDMIPAF
jgi:cob(I)alamin adenosyltransferase